jgi:hypothetical protein
VREALHSTRRRSGRAGSWPTSAVVRCWAVIQTCNATLPGTASHHTAVNIRLKILASACQDQAARCGHAGLCRAGTTGWQQRRGPRSRGGRCDTIDRQHDAEIDIEKNGRVNTRTRGNDQAGTVSVGGDCRMDPLVGPRNSPRDRDQLMKRVGDKFVFNYG